MLELLKNPNVIAGIVSAITALIVLFITLFTKNYIERNLLTSKLNIEYKFSQRKQIKEILGLNKVQLNNVCNELKKRIGNHYRNNEKGWLKRNTSTYDDEYFSSFIYRFISVFAWIEIIERELFFLDSTVSVKSDLEFIKFLKIFQRVMCSDYLPKHNSEGKEINDHFNRDDLKELAIIFITQKTVITYSQFKLKLKKDKNQFIKVCNFFDNINPIENRVRWDRLYYLQLCISAYLNQFGYDFQFSPPNKIKFYFTKPRYSKNYNDFLILCSDYKLSKNKGIKMIAKLIKKEKFTLPRAECILRSIVYQSIQYLCTNSK